MYLDAHSCLVFRIEIDVLGVELFQYLSNLLLVSPKPTVAVEARNHQPRLRTIDSSICGPNDVLPCLSPYYSTFMTEPTTWLCTVATAR